MIERPTILGEVAGQAAHDGMRFEVPANVVGVVLITMDDDGRALRASLSHRRDSGITEDETVEVLANLVFGYLENQAEER